MIMLFSAYTAVYWFQNISVVSLPCISSTCILTLMLLYAYWSDIYYFDLHQHECTFFSEPDAVQWLNWQPLNLKNMCLIAFLKAINTWETLYAYCIYMCNNVYSVSQKNVKYNINLPFLSKKFKTLQRILISRWIL
jgi:hypothetical protein